MARQKHKKEEVKKDEPVYEQWMIDEVSRCRYLPSYFINKYWKYQDKDSGSARVFKLRDYQHNYCKVRWRMDAVTREWENPKIIWLKPRQIGASTLEGGADYWTAAFNPLRHILVMSATEWHAHAFLARVKFGWRHLPWWMRIPLLHETKSMMHLGIRAPGENGGEIVYPDSLIESVPTTEAAAVSQTLTDVTIDEADIIDSALLLEILERILPALEESRGRITLLSTGEMAGDTFYRLVKGAQAKRNGYYFIFTPFDAVEGRTWEWREKKIRESLEPDRVRQLYPATVEEAFLSPGQGVFDKRKVLEALDRAKVVWEGELWGDELTEQEPGHLRVWKRPEKMAEGGAESVPFVIGADVAAGIEGGDYSVAQVLDRRSGEQVAVWHGHVDEFEFAEVLNALGRLYWWAYLAVEVTGGRGTAVARYLEELEYPNLMYRQVVDESGGPIEGRKLGWDTSPRTRNYMIADMVRAFAKNDVRLNDPGTLEEMLHFVRNAQGKPEAARGCHDDRVMALGVAIQAMNICPLAVAGSTRLVGMTETERLVREVEEGVGMDFPEFFGQGGGSVGYY